eukprot:3941859-Rhodomonas_salina.2
MKAYAAKAFESPVYVAEDYRTSQGKNVKRFSAYPTYSHFLDAILHSEKPCFYEMIPMGKQVKLYFDIEWEEPVPAPAIANLNIETILHAIQYELSAKFPLADKTCIPLNSTRETKANKKVSYHLVYPCVVFPDNTNEIVAFVKGVSQRVAALLPVHTKNPIDMSVYSRDRLFRAPMCYKETDKTQTKL